MSTIYNLNVQGVGLEDWLASLLDGAQLQLINVGAMSLFCKDTNQFYFIRDHAISNLQEQDEKDETK